MAIFNSYVSLPEGITFLNTSKRWNMKRSNWLKPEFSAGLLLLDAIWLLFQPFEQHRNARQLGSWWPWAAPFRTVMFLWFTRIHCTWMVWDATFIISAGIYMDHAVFFSFFLSRSGRALLYLAWFIWYKCIYTYICPTSRSPTADILTCPRSSQR